MTERVPEAARFSSRRVAFRVDGSAEIGSGHIRRCLSVALVLRDAGGEVCFVLRDFGRAFADPVVAAGFEIRWLPAVPPPPPGKRTSADWACVPQERDVEESVALLRAWQPAWVVVDHYGLSAEWHLGVAARLGCAIAAIDDLGDRPIAAALLIDHNPSPDHRVKYGASLAQTGRLLGGPRYALLAPVYRHPPQYRLDDAVKSVGIFMGGVDRANFSAMALSACREAGFAGPVEVVSTSANPSLDALRQAVEADGAATLLLDVENLADFFARHDLQIGAGGGASWERCRVGAPAIVLRCADNQAIVTAALRAAEAALTVEQPSTRAIVEVLRPALADRTLRSRLAERSAALVDGRGCERIAVALLADRMQLRAANRDDAEAMLAWRNDGSVRAMSRDAGEIDLDAHLAWFERVLADPNRLLFIGQLGAVSIGVLRYDFLSPEMCEVSIYLDPAFQGLGAGGRLLDAGERHLAELGRDVEIVAEFRSENLASRRMFEAAGFRGDGNRVSKFVSISSAELAGQS